MYYPHQQDNGQWVVMFEGRMMGPAPDKGGAYRIAAYMNGGDFELVLNITWEYFINGGVTQPQVSPPIIVDVGHDKPSQL